MLNLLLNSTFWSTLVLAGFLLVVRMCHRNPSSLLTRVSNSRTVITLLLLGSLSAAGFSLYLSHVAPRDVMQDIVAAQEWQQGRSMHPADMTSLIREALEHEPARFSLGSWWPRLAEIEQQQYQEVINAHWVQAHPPPMTLFISPFVALTGVHGAALAINMISLVALLLTLWMIQCELKLPLTRLQTLMLAALILGWHPIDATLRHGQSGLLLAVLMTAGWFGLRRGRPQLAGMSIGVATCLKMYPGLLLVYLFFRHRQAFVEAAATILLIGVGTGMFAGWHNFADYFASARFVSENYGAHEFNLSLRALLLHLTSELNVSPAIARGLFLAMGSAIGSGLVWLFKNRTAGEERSHSRLDLEFSLAITLMPLLSPIAWHHFLSILLLPLAVLGQRAFEPSRSRALEFVSLFLLLALPDDWPWLFHLSDGPVLSLLVFSASALPTLALLVISGWLAIAIHQQRVVGWDSVPTTPTGRDGVPTYEWQA
jgi:uncharacterized Tic20 family protein